MLAELAGEERRDRAAGEADEAVRRGGDRPLDARGRHDRLGQHGVDDPEQSAGHDHDYDQHRLVIDEEGADEQVDRERGESDAERRHEPGRPLERLGAEHGGQCEQHTPAEEHVAQLADA